MQSVVFFVLLNPGVDHWPPTQVLDNFLNGCAAVNVNDLPQNRFLSDLFADSPNSQRSCILNDKDLIKSKNEQSVGKR